MTGKILLDNILIGISLLMTIATIGTFVYTNILYDKPLPQDEVEFAQLKKDNDKTLVADSLKLDKIIINLPSKTRRLRFLDTTIHLVPFKPHFMEKMEENKAMINDIIIDVTSRMEPEELNSVAGKILLEGRIKTHINKSLKGDIVREIHFSKFVIQ